MKRAFKYRFYPTDAQAAELSRTFGCVRKVYNLALEARTEAWARQERVNYNADLGDADGVEEDRGTGLPVRGVLGAAPAGAAAPAGGVHQLLRQAGEVPAVQVAGRSPAQSAEYTSSAFRYRDGELTLAKMSEPLDIVWSRPLPEGAEPSTVTVSQDAAGRWFVSLLCDDTGVKPLPATDAAVGIDAGLTTC